jgi:hypothetical protein
MNVLEECMISGFHRGVDENCTLLDHDVASSGNSLPTFRDNVSGPYSRVKNPFRKDITTSRCVTNQKNAVLILEETSGL